MSRYTYNIGLTFSDRASREPDRTALTFATGAATSYGELNALSNKVAAVLVARGLRRRDVLAIVHDKTPICYAAMLAALKLGVTYVNIDDQNPPARLSHIFNRARPNLVFANAVPESVASVAFDTGVAILAVGDEDAARELRSATDADPLEMRDVAGSDPAYIMFTSGSTGVPKGALMTHANVLRFGEWIGDRFGVTERDVLTNVNPMYFDNSVFDFYGAMLNGAALAPITRDALSNAKEVLRQVEATNCTLWFSVPSMLIYMMSMKVLKPESLPRVRAFVFGGEGYPKPELLKLFDLYGRHARLINVYGPTECTCMCSAWDCRAEDLADLNGFVTLGPIAENFAMLVLDGDRPVAPGEVGELCLLGPQVGLGYVRDAERTSASFVQNPENDRWVERMYRTGDLVRLGVDGRMLDFVGRKDNQIKHMGYRIELEEIEAAINQVDGVTRSAVLQKNGTRDMKMIVAYVATEKTIDEKTMRAKLAELLPPYMIPQRFDIRDDLPKNANGKVDKVTLAAWE